MEQSPRFKLWCLYAAFTLIVLISIGQVETDVDANDNVDDVTAKSDKGWGLALSILSFIAMIGILYAHTNTTYRPIIINTNIEGITLLILLLFSTILVAIVTGPQRGLAVDSNGAVFVGNMYYFAWASFFTGIITLSSFLQQIYGFNLRQTMQSKSSSFTYWSALLVSSMVVMGTSSDIYNRNCDVQNDEKPQPFCSRSVLAVVVGSIGVLLSLTILIMKMSFGNAPFLTEVTMNLTLFLLYVVEVSYITDAEGPGAPLGNLYYFSWISFLLTFMVGKACYEDYNEAQHVVVDQHGGGRHETELPSLEDDHDDAGAGVVATTTSYEETPSSSSSAISDNIQEHDIEQYGIKSGN